MKKHQGFVLVYTVLILSVMLVIGGIFADTVMKEISISRDEAESLKAFYAADAGIECMRFYSNNFDAFNTKMPQGTYSCGVGAAFQAGGNPPTANCEARTYNIPITGFTNGSCTQVTVKTIPRTVVLGGVPRVVCSIEVVSNGRNTCAAGATKVVERTRWENM